MPTPALRKIALQRSNPDSLRTMLQMSSMMRGAGADPFGGLGGAGGFPAPGNPSGGFPAPGTPGNAISPSSTAAGSPPVPGANPLASLFGAPGGAGAGAGGAPGGAGTGNPFGALDPAMMQQLLAIGGGGGAAGGAGAGNPFGGFGTGGAPAAPADTRPPEERFQIQLQVMLLFESTIFAY